MAAAGSDGSSHTQVIVIGTVASIGGVLVLVVIVAIILYLRKRRRYDAPANGVIAQDAARIEDEDPEGSGWVEGTWTGDGDSGTLASTRRTGSSRRKQNLSNAHGPTPPLPPLSSAALSPAETQDPLSESQAYRIAPAQMAHARADPTPVSPTSSFGNLTSTVPDSATYLLSPFPTSGFPKHPLPAATPNPTPPPPSDPSDTFLDMSRASPDADAGHRALSSRPTHPFANPSAIAPSAYVRQQDRSGRQRSDSDQSTRSNRSQRGHAPSGGATVPTSASTSALVSTQRPQARGPVHKTSGSDLASASEVSSMMMSPSSALQTLASTATTPTSTTMLMPKRHPSNAGAARSHSQPEGAGAQGTPAQASSRLQSHSRSQPQSQPQSQPRAHSAPRRVDPVDPSIRTREPAAVERQRSDRRRRDQGRERERSRDRGQAQAPAPVREEKRAQGGGRRQGVVVSEREREQFGNFLDVPQDAGDRPPSYRES